MVCGVLCSLWSGSNLRLLLCSLLLSRGYLYVCSSLLLLRSDLVPMILSAGISFDKTLNMLRLFLPVVFEDVECLVAVHFLYGFRRVCYVWWCFKASELGRYQTDPHRHHLICLFLGLRSMKVLFEKTAAVVTQSLMPSSMIKVTNSAASISSLDQIVCPSTENLDLGCL